MTLVFAVCSAVASTVTSYLATPDPTSAAASDDSVGCGDPTATPPTGETSDTVPGGGASTVNRRSALSVWLPAASITRTRHS